MSTKNNLAIEKMETKRDQLNARIHIGKAKNIRKIERAASKIITTKKIII